MRRRLMKKKQKKKYKAPMRKKWEVARSSFDRITNDQAIFVFSNQGSYTLLCRCLSVVSFRDVRASIRGEIT